MLLWWGRAGLRGTAWVQRGGCREGGGAPLSLKSPARLQNPRFPAFPPPPRSARPLGVGSEAGGPARPRCVPVSPASPPRRSQVLVLPHAMPYVFVTHFTHPGDVALALGAAPPSPGDVVVVYKSFYFDFTPCSAQPDGAVALAVLGCFWFWSLA